MRTSMRLCLTVAALALLLSGSPARADVIVCFGDSNTEGGTAFGIPHVGYPGPLQGMLGGDSVVNAGKGGESAFSGTFRFPGVMQTHRPKFALIMEGTNDIGVFSAATVAFNLASMAAVAREHGTTPIVSTLIPNTRKPEQGALVPSYNAAIAQMASEQKIVLVDSHGRVAGNWGQMTSDGMHTNYAGASAIAQGFADTVNANRGGGGGGGGGGGCFIATAAFGSYAEPHVMVLREFRDHILLPRKIGQWFVGQYYKYSPPVADFIADRPALKAAVRTSLLPVVGLAWLGLHHPALLFAGLLAMLALGAVTLRRLRRQTP